MENIVIELARYNADNVQPDTNGAWTSKLSKPITLNQGDVCMVKQAFIDCTVIDNGSIFIENDTSITFQFLYWTQNHGINMYNMTTVNGVITYGTVEPDGLPYMLVNTQPDTYPYTINQQYKPVINSKTINLKKGVYAMEALAENISRQFQEIKQVPNDEIKNYKFFKGYSLPIYDGNGNLSYFTPPQMPAPNVVNDDNRIVCSFTLPLYFGIYIEGDGPTPPDEYRYTLFYINPDGDLTPCSYYQMTDNPKYNYNGYNLITRYGSADDFLGKSYFNDSGYTMYDAGLIGASEIAMVFNQTGDNVGRFSFSYAHSPLKNENAEVIGTFNFYSNVDSLQNQNVFLNAYSGIMFLNIYQGYDNNTYSPLMEQLGFVQNDLIPLTDIKNVFKQDNYFNETATNITFFSYYNTFLPYTTRNFFPIQGIISNATTDVAGQNSTTYKMNNYSLVWNFYVSNKFYTFTDSDSTDPLRASKYPLSSNSETGHYLIQLSGYGTNSEFINNEKLLMIKGIIGNYMYSTNSFAMSLGPDSAVYVHNSVIPLTLSSIDVSLLNPLTKKPDPNLGLNSCVYLQITREGNPPPIEGQPTKKDEPKN